MSIKRFIKTLTGGVALSLALPLSAIAAGTMTVTPANTQGWVFNRDVSTSTPYEFNEDEASTGDGSLYVLPIGATPANKFIAEKTLNTQVVDFQGVSYDFLIAGDGTPADAQQFYLNVYTNLSGSNTFYDCRFDYVPTTGSTTDFTTATFNKGDTPTAIGDRSGDGFTCPTTLAGMPAGSKVSFVALNVGDTSANDAGLAGYLDNVVISNVNDSTTYDFELLNTPDSKDQCKDGGYKNYTDDNGVVFRNQGQCVKYVNGAGNNNSSVNNNNVNVVNNSNQRARSGNSNVSGNTNGGSSNSGNSSNTNSSTFNVQLSNF
jgi:hypothetical protein